MTIKSFFASSQPQPGIVSGVKPCTIMSIHVIAHTSLGEAFSYFGAGPVVSLLMTGISCRTVSPLCLREGLMRHRLARRIPRTVGNVQAGNLDRLLRDGGSRPRIAAKINAARAVFQDSMFRSSRIGCSYVQ